MFKRLIVSVLLFTLLLTGCATSAQPTPSPEMLVERSVSVEQSAPGSGGVSDAYLESQPSSTNSQPAERIVIMNASLSIIVDDPGSAMDTVAKMAKDMGGFTVSSQLFKIQTSQGLDVPQASITIRVPSDQLTDAMGQIKGMVKNPKTDIPSENVTGQDVTKEYTDLQSRLKNLQTAETQLQKIMDRATKIEDVIMVYNQLISTREQIEVLQGQISYYEESARLSAIAVEIIASESVKPISVAGWQPVGIARDALQALINVLKFLVSAFLYIIILIIPTLLFIAAPIVLVIWIINRIVRRARRNRQAKQQAPIAKPQA
jgi:hypothetical protein